MTITKTAMTPQTRPVARTGEWSRLGEHRGEETAGDGIVGRVHQHDDQHAASCVIEDPVEDDHSGENQHDVGVVNLPSDHERQMPAGDKGSQNQARDERGSAAL